VGVGSTGATGGNPLGFPLGLAEGTREDKCVRSGGTVGTNTSNRSTVGASDGSHLGRNEGTSTGRNDTLGGVDGPQEEEGSACVVKGVEDGSPDGFRDSRSRRKSTGD
jgi:hypothetical protein